MGLDGGGQHLPSTKSRNLKQNKMVRPNLYFANWFINHYTCLVPVEIWFSFTNSSKFNSFLAVLGIVLQVDKRDAMIVSWSAHLIGCIVPFLLTDIEFEDRRDGYSFSSFFLFTFPS